LGTILNISLLVTTNSDVNTFDKAVTRRGRLALQHDFGPLKTEEAQRLLTHLGKPDKAIGPMTLADIYLSGDDTGYVAPTTSRQMGFHTLIGTTPKESAPQEKRLTGEKD
jgi:hypothetical protein